MSLSKAKVFARLSKGFQTLLGPEVRGRHVVDVDMCFSDFQHVICLSLQQTSRRCADRVIQRHDLVAVIALGDLFFVQGTHDQHMAAFCIAALRMDDVFLYTSVAGVWVAGKRRTVPQDTGSERCF